MIAIVNAKVFEQISDEGVLEINVLINDCLGYLQSTEACRTPNKYPATFQGFNR